MKLLLYCTKAKPILRIAKEEMKGQKRARCYSEEETEYFTQYIEEEMYEANGKIVAECDYEVDEIEMLGDEINIYYGIEREACLTIEQIENYFGYNNDYKGYAIHIKNLHIFDEPKELSSCWANTNAWIFDNEKLDVAPQNMRRCGDWNLEKAILISIKPEWLCKILNGEKTIEVRKKVLKEMMKND